MVSAANSRIQKIYRFLHFYLFIYFTALNSSLVWILISSAFGNCYHCNSTQLHNNEKKNPSSTWPCSSPSFGCGAQKIRWDVRSLVHFSFSDSNHCVINSCHWSEMMLVANSLPSPSPCAKCVASPVTMVIWHFMLTESTGFRSSALQCDYDTLQSCIQQSVSATDLITVTPVSSLLWRMFDSLFCITAKKMWFSLIGLINWITCTAVFLFS